MVTTEMKEQIRTAVHARNACLYSEGNGVDGQAACGGQYTGNIGCAKKRLPLAQSIRTTKMLFDWLNVGEQKRRMKKDGTCPCCGVEEEDFLHMYHCTNERMQQTFREAICTLKSALVKDGIPSEIYNAFIAAMCTSAHQLHPDQNYSPNEAAEEMLELQESLGCTAILKGFHHVEWAYWLHREWQPPPPRKDGKKAFRKDALEQSVALIKGAWDVFEAVWATRNDILHGDNNAILRGEEDYKTARLLEFKRNPYELLSRADHFLIDYSEWDIRHWTMERKRKRLLNLERMHRRYLCELRAEAEGLRQITDYFAPVERSDGDGGN